MTIEELIQAGIEALDERWDEQLPADNYQRFLERAVENDPTGSKPAEPPADENPPETSGPADEDEPRRRRGMRFRIVGNNESNVASTYFDAERIEPVLQLLASVEEEEEASIRLADGRLAAAAGAEGLTLENSREETHTAPSMDLCQALYEMDLVGHDFYLFVDADTKLPSVVYRRHGYDYGVIRLEETGAAHYSGSGLGQEGHDQTLVPHHEDQTGHSRSDAG